MILYTDIDPFCCEVLRARVADGGLLPGEVWERDVRTLTAAELEPFTQIHLFAGIGASPLGLRWAGWPDDWSIITGGFPCQDISSAGKGAGLDGERSGLFFEFVRIAGIKRADSLIAENVGALSARGLDRVVGALEPLGYEVHALRLGAWAVGSPQVRERWWIVAGTGASSQLADVRARGHGAVGVGGARTVTDEPGTSGDAMREGLEGPIAGEAGPDGGRQPRYASPRRWPHVLWVDENGDPVATPQYEWEQPRLYTRGMAGLADGIPARLASALNKCGVAATGNAQVPQNIEVIARAIMAAATTTGDDP